MSTLTLKPITGQHFKIQPEQTHVRMTLRRVLYVKFLRWVDKASWQKLGASLTTALCALGIVAAVIAPQFILGALYSATTWHGYRIPLVCASLAVFFFGSSAWRTFQKLRVRRARTGNQNTWNGVPVDEMASYLLEQKQFTREHAMAALHISREKYDTMAKELEGRDVLHRGENNARVLTPITREQLCLQLTQKYPLVYDQERSEWVQRDGAFAQWTLNREQKEQRELDQRRKRVERLERRRDALEEEVGTLESVGFISRALEIA
jgi:hypothetical protein